MLPESTLNIVCDSNVRPSVFRAFQNINAIFHKMTMRPEGLEPPSLSGQDPKSCASASFATAADSKNRYDKYSVKEKVRPEGLEPSTQ